MIIKVYNYIRRIIFYSYNSFLFKRLEFSSTIFSPFRIDGKNKIELNKNTVIQKNSWIYAYGTNSSIKIGNNCTLGYNNHIVAINELIIEDFVLTANNIYISDNIHSYENINIPIMKQEVKFVSKVVIGKGSWIGENVSIIGAKIGKNCVIGANSVVTKDIPDYSVAVGVPAKVIKKYDFKNKIWIKI